jgi:GNAT superfamily N-acetyltransferase
VRQEAHIARTRTAARGITDVAATTINAISNDVEKTEAIGDDGLIEAQIRPLRCSERQGRRPTSAVHRPRLDGSGQTVKHCRMSRAINPPRPPEIQIAPLTPARWADLEIVFGAGRGVCSQCWCMYWRMPRRDFEASLGAGTRQLFRARVEAGPPPGLLAYRAGAPVGWVQVGPRADVPGWNGARRLTAPTAEAPAENPQVWGISCFVTKAGYRRQGIATALLAGAVGWARQNGARVLDACPVDANAYRAPISLYHGLASTFRRAGFREVARRRPDRPLMRLELGA